jgi:mannosyltransferase
MGRWKPFTPIILLGIVIIGFFFRIYHLAAVPLRGDEAFSVLYWAGLPLSKSLTTIATLEPHPALIYVIFRGWGLLAGDTEFAMRYLPTLVNLLGVPAIFAIGIRLSGWRLGLLAALLFALNPYEIWHAQDVRNYAMWAGVSLIALWLGLCALDSLRKRDWLFYTLSATLAANLFYSELLILTAFGVFVFITRCGHWKILTRWLITAAVAGLTAAASFLILQGGLFGSGSYSGNATKPVDVTYLLTAFLPTLTFGTTLPPDFLDSVWLLVALALVVGLFTLWRHHRRTAILLSALGIIPPLLLSLISLRVSIFDPRYILAAAPAYSLIVASLVIQAATSLNRAGRYISVILLFVWLIICGYSLYNHYYDPIYLKSKDWPSIARFLHQNVNPANLVIQSTVDPAFGYYYHRSSLELAVEIALPAYPTQPELEIQNNLEAYAARYPGIWRVGQTLAEWNNANVVENWLDTHLQLTRSEQIAGLQLRQYMPWQVGTNEINSSTLANFSDVVELVGYQTFLERYGNLTVWLYWRPLATTQNPLKVFVHLLGTVNPATGSPLWSQDDHYPQNERIATRNWSTATLYRDVYSLTLADVPAGSYSVQIGFYDPSSNQRLPVGNRDSYLLTSIDLK